MLKQIFGVLTCLVLLVIFLVLFGGFAFIDFAIKLMWLAFSFLITFACQNLNITFVVDRLNKFLGKYNFHVTEAPKIRADGITLYNLTWRDEVGNFIRIPQAEVRIDAYRVMLDFFKEDKEKYIFADIKEISLKQPQIEWQFRPQALANTAITTNDDYKNMVLDAVSQHYTLEELTNLSLKLNLTNGTIKLKIADQLLELDNIEGGLINEPALVTEQTEAFKQLFNLHLTCQYEGENISIRNQEAADVFVVNSSKIFLPKIWPILKLYLPVIPEKLDIQDGRFTDGRLVLATDKWTTLRLVEMECNLEECSLVGAGVKLENIEGRFVTRDFRSLTCRKLEFDFNEQHVRLSGLVQLTANKNEYTYQIKSGTNRFSWKNNVDIYILPGFCLHGSVKVTDEISLHVESEENTAVRIHTQTGANGNFNSFKGDLAFRKGILAVRGLSCIGDEKPLAIKKAFFNFVTGDYAAESQAEVLNLQLLSDAPVSGKISYDAHLKGNWSKKIMQVEGDYEVIQVRYEPWKVLNLGEGLIKGHFTWVGEKLQLENNWLYLGEHKWELPLCEVVDGKLKIKFPVLEDVFAKKMASAGNFLQGSWEKIKNKF